MDHKSEADHLWDELPKRERIEIILNTFAPETWFDSPAFPALAGCRADKRLWGKIKARGKALGVNTWDFEKAVDDFILHAQTTNGTTAEVLSTTLPEVVKPWREYLLCKKNGDPTVNMGNMGLILGNHQEWAQHFWWDAVRGLPMYFNETLTDEFITYVAQWFAVQERMGIANTKPLRECLIAECRKNPKDLLQQWLNGLPPWDGIERLPLWLHDVAGTANTIYGQTVSRILPLSMVARAMQPGCLYRNVVILEGEENTGKSSLVLALAGGKDWYVELTSSLENKESHMTIQGAWLAEMAELDSLSRTEETRLKAFITLREDTWIPKYSNFRISVPRRTILVGTTNETSYLKGQTGNTRFLPIKTGTIDVTMLEAMREQLFAEALHMYRTHAVNWWVMPDEALAAAAEEREQRRLAAIYEDELGLWLDQERFHESLAQEGRNIPTRGETTWAEIAQYFLRLETRERWKDIVLQKQIATALKALGWHQRVCKREGKTLRVWLQENTTTYEEGTV